MSKDKNWRCFNYVYIIPRLNTDHQIGQGCEVQMVSFCEFLNRPAQHHIRSLAEAFGKQAGPRYGVCPPIHRGVPTCTRICEVPDVQT